MRGGSIEGLSHIATCEEKETYEVFDVNPTHPRSAPVYYPTYPRSENGQQLSKRPSFGVQYDADSDDRASLPNCWSISDGRFPILTDGRKEPFPWRTFFIQDLVAS
jgi:hypothetical protein